MEFIFLCVCVGSEREDFVERKEDRRIRGQNEWHGG